MRAVWQRVRPHPQAVAHVPPIPLQAPALRVVHFVSFHRAADDAPLSGARPYTLRAHAQARWRPLTG